MAPTAITSHELSNNGKHQTVKSGRDTGNVPPKMTSADVVHLEHEYGAHK